MGTVSWVKENVAETRWYMRRDPLRVVAARQQPPDVMLLNNHWWLVPYAAFAPHELQRVGPFSTRELAQAAAEALYETGTNLFEEDV